MSYRDTLICLREDLLDTERAIADCELQVPSLTARILLSRVRSFIGVGRRLITQALGSPHDAMSPPRIPATESCR